MITKVDSATKLKICINISADVYVIPDRIGTLKPNSFSDINKIVEIANIAKANSIDYDFRRDNVIRIVWISGELNSDDIAGSGFNIVMEPELGGIVYRVDKKYLNGMSMMPAKMFYDMEEGDRKIFMFPIHVPEDPTGLYGGHPEIDIELVIAATASQTQYRFNRLGGFEQLVSRLDR